MLMDKIIGALDHEANDFIGGVHNPQSISPLGIIGLVKVFVHHFEKLLLFVMIENACGFCFNDIVISVQSTESLTLCFSGEECLFDPQ